MKKLICILFTSSLGKYCEVLGRFLFLSCYKCYCLFFSRWLSMNILQYLFKNDVSIKISTSELLYCW